MNGHSTGIDGFIFYITPLEAALCMNIEGKLKN